MQQVAVQQGLLWRALVVQPLVDEPFPLGEAAPPNADFGLGIESTSLHPLSAVIVEAVHSKDLILGDFLVFQCFNGLFQLIREGFIGINGKDEVAGGEFIGEVLLFGIAKPVLAKELHAVAVADSLGRIGGMRVNNDNLIGNILNGVKALRNFLLLVEGDDDDRNAVHCRKFSAKLGFFSYFCGLFEKMHVGIPIWMLVVSLLAGLAAATVLYFRNKKQHYGKVLTAILFALRTLMVGLVVLLLFNPLIRQKFSSVETPTIILAHDNSSSITLCKDSTFYKNDYLTQFGQFRKDLNDHFNVDEYLFGEEVRDFDQLDFSDQLTDLSSLFRTMDRRYYKRNVGVVLLFSDGIYNRGFEPELVAEKFPFPVHSVVLGDTVSYPDLAIRDVHYNKVVSLGATFPVRVTVTARDMAGQKAQLVLKENGRIIEKRDINIPSNRFSKEIDFMLDAERKGVMQIDLELGGVAGEEQLQNNVRHIFIEVLDQKYKILCVANAPHPDLASLRSVLNDNYEVDFCFGKETLPDFEKYDLIILHQVPSARTDLAALKSQLDRNAKLPVFFILGGETDVQSLSKLQQVFDLRKGATNTMLDVKAHANPSFSTFTMDTKEVEKTAKFPPLAMPHLEINTLKSHDDLLLQEVMGVKSGLPLLSFANDGRKMAFLFGTNVWRWRLFEYYQTKGHAVFDEMFSKSLKYLLLSSNDGSAIYAKETYYSNEPVIITAELRNPSNELVTDPEMTIQIVNKLTNEAYDYTFSKRDHDYELNAGILPEGLYYYKVQAQMGDRMISLGGSFSVVSLGIEAQQLTADAERMRSLARLTNGNFYSAQQLTQLMEDLHKDTRITSVEHHESRFEDLIHSKWIFFVLIGLAAVEWLLRKMFGSY